MKVYNGVVDIYHHDDKPLPERLRAIGNDIFNGEPLDEGHIEDIKLAAEIIDKIGTP